MLLATRSVLDTRAVPPFGASAGTAAFLDGGARAGRSGGTIPGVASGGPRASIAAIGGLPSEGGDDGQRLVDGCDESGGLGPSNTAKGTAHD